MPSAGLTKFHGQPPLDFLMTHAVAPGDHMAIERATKNMGGSHLVLKSDARIALFDLVKDRGPATSPEAGAYKVITRALSTVAQTDRAAYEACYYLPWTAGGGIVETILEPPPALQRGRSGAVVAPPPKGRIQLGAQRDQTREDATHNASAGLDPDIFFTTQLSGCSVFIRGSAQKPTVYHAGAGKTIAADPTTYWRDLYKNVAAKSGGQADPYVEVNKGQYNYQTKTNVGTTDETARTNRNFTEFAQILISDERRLKRPFFMHMVSGWGNVFGLRNPVSRDWTFYRQEVVHIIYSRVAGAKMTDPANKVISKVAALTEIFPTTRALTTPKLSCMPLKP